MSVKERILGALRRYALSLDIESARAYAGESPSELARYALEEIAVGRASHAESIACLLSSLVVRGLLSSAALNAGIKATFERLQDLLLDAPAALDQLSCALAWLALDGVISENIAGSAAAEASAAGDLGAAGRLGALQKLVDEWLAGSTAPLALVQLRRVFGEALQSFLVSLDVDALQVSVATVHARHASSQLVRKALQRAVHADTQQRRWLFEAIAVLSGPGRMLSIDDVAAGVAAFLYALPSIAAAEDASATAAAEAASSLLAAAMAAGILPPVAVTAAAAAAGHEAAARCVAASSSAAGAATAAAEAAAVEGGAAAAAAAARALWGEGTISGLDFATSVDARLAAIAGNAGSAGRAAGMAVDASSAGSGDSASGGAGSAAASAPVVASGEADVEDLAEGLLPRSAAAADAARPVIVFRALCAALAAGEADAAETAGAAGTAPPPAGTDAPSRLARALIYLAHTRRLRDADVARGCRAFLCSSRAGDSRAPAGAVRAFEFLARSGVLESADVGSVARAALSVHEEGEPLPTAIAAVLARLRAK